MAVLGLCFDTLKEGDHSACNVTFHEFMVDYNNRDDARTALKPQHVEAWQSPEALLQFSIDIYGYAACINLKVLITIVMLIFGLRSLMNQSPPFCNMSRAIRRQFMIKWIHKSAIIAMATQTSSYLLLLFGPAPERLIKASSVSMGLTLGEVIRPAASRLRPIVLLRVANDKLLMMR